MTTKDIKEPTTPINQPIIFYCKDCKKIVKCKKKNPKKKYKIQCDVCNKRNIDYGKEKNIIKYYRRKKEKKIKKAEPTEIKKEEVKKD